MITEDPEFHEIPGMVIFIRRGLEIQLFQIVTIHKTFLFVFTSVFRKINLKVAFKMHN